MTSIIRDTDVLVVGGGPAGLAAAIAVRRKGFRVTVADCAAPPADKACGEGLMPDALAALARLGIRIDDSESYPFRGIRFLDSGVEIDASFPSGVGRGARRTTLHRKLLDHAEASGVSVVWGARVSLPELAGCRWIIGADGENSRVRAWAGIRVRGRGRRRFGFRRHYRIEPWTDCTEIYWGDVCQIYVTPVGPDAVCIAALSDHPHYRLEHALAEFPALLRRLQGSEAITPERGAISASRRLRSVQRGRVALVGDASGSVDAITGEGLCLSFQQAIALADALESGDLAKYQKRHRQIARRPGVMAAILLSLADNTRLRHGVIRMLESNPSIFSKMLSMHVGGSYEHTNFHSPVLRDVPVWTGDCAGARSGADPR